MMPLAKWAAAPEELVIKGSAIAYFIAQLYQVTWQTFIWLFYFASEAHDAPLFFSISWYRPAAAPAYSGYCQSAHLSAPVYSHHHT
jgi:hypothetical protein